MNEKEFIEFMMDLTDTEMTLTMDTLLKDVEEWDSLSFVSFQANARVKNGLVVSPSDVKNAKTVRDLFVLMSKG